MLIMERTACPVRLCSFAVTKFLFILVLSLCYPTSQCKKIRYAVKTECDRYSLDAVYHDKYKPITNNIFTDSKEFVGRVTDLLADSLISVMAQLPGRDASDNEERKIHTQFKNVKTAFSSKLKTAQMNVTTSWEDLIPNHFDLMFDNANATLETYETKITRMADSYTSAHKRLDTLLSNFVSFMKKTMHDSLLGIEAAAEFAIKEEEKKNQTEGTDDNNSPEDKSKDEVLREKMEDIAKMVVPGFLGKVTVEAIKRRLDLSKESTSKPEDRDNPFDDIEFDVLMIKNRIRAIVQLDVPKDKGQVDLARRSIYTYWADLAEGMYQQKLESAKKPTQDKPRLTGRLYYQDLWKDEEQILETLLDLLEMYS